MRTVLAAITTFLLFAAAPMAQTSENERSLAKAAVAAFHEALSAGNADAAMQLLAPDAVVIEGGTLETRKQYQEHHLAADIEFAQAVKTVRSGISATVSGEVAWVSSSSVASGSYKGKNIDLSGAELMVLSKAPAGWRIRAIHWSSHARR